MKDVLDSENYGMESVVKTDKDKESDINVSNKKPGYKTKKCKVLGFNPKDKSIDVLFDNYGIRIYHAQKHDGETIDVKYKGEIGSKNFEYKL